MGHQYRLLLDESVEHEVLDLLDTAGHDVVHVDFSAALGKGADDAAIARYSLADERFVVTYDEDFVTEFDDTDYRATSFFEDATTSARNVARAIDAMSEFYDPGEIRGLVEVGREWLVE